MSATMMESVTERALPPAVGTLRIRYVNRCIQSRCDAPTLPVAGGRGCGYGTEFEISLPLLNYRKATAGTSYAKV